MESYKYKVHTVVIDMKDINFLGCGLCMRYVIHRLSPSIREAGCFDLPASGLRHPASG